MLRPKGLRITFQRAAGLCLYTCGLARTVVLAKLKILSCCMRKTSWGAARGRKAVLLVAVILRKSPADQAAWTQSRPSLWLCVPLAPSCPEAGQRQRVAGESDSTLQSLPPSPGQCGSAIRCAVLLLLTCKLMGEWCHTQPLCPLGAAPLVRCSGDWDALCEAPADICPGAHTLLVPAMVKSGKKIKIALKLER